MAEDKTGRTAADIRRTARRELGIKRLRPGQMEAIRAVLDRRDVLCVLASGYGKSAIYQVAGSLLEGPTVVVSPLIALQRDQAEAIDDGGEEAAAVLNSALGDSERKRVLQAARRGRVRFLLLAPEQLANRRVIAELRAAHPSLIVVDEAHCVAQWGHDFRPDYLHLGDAARALGRPPILALTATAAPPVRAEIVASLDLADPAVVVGGFDRPNIHLAVRRFHDAETKRSALMDAVVEADGAGIVYVATRRATSSLAGELASRGVAAEAYHAGIGDRRRERAERRFRDGDCRVVVATVAFGMGIDKPDVRWVHHLDVSDSLDAYYQEVGRAGRDGAAAEAVLFYRPEDLGLRRFFASGATPRELIERTVGALPAGRRGCDVEDLARVLGVASRRLLRVLGLLEQAGFVELHAGGVRRVRRQPAEDAVDAALAADERRISYERSRVDVIRSYAERSVCRRALLLGYLGEDYVPPCGNCDNCEAAAAVQGGSRDEKSVLGLRPGDRVRHRRWGEGTVAADQGGRLVVAFDSVGYKELDDELIAERRLIRRT